MPLSHVAYLPPGYHPLNFLFALLGVTLDLLAAVEVPVRLHLVYEQYLLPVDVPLAHSQEEHVGALGAVAHVGAEVWVLVVRCAQVSLEVGQRDQ